MYSEMEANIKSTSPYCLWDVPEDAVKQLALVSSGAVYPPEAWSSLPALNVFWTPQNLMNEYYNQVGVSMPYMPYYTPLGSRMDKYEAKSESTTKDLGSLDEAQLAFSKIGRSYEQLHSEIFYSLTLYFGFLRV